MHTAPQRRPPSFSLAPRIIVAGLAALAGCASGVAPDVQDGRVVFEDRIVHEIQAQWLEAGVLSPLDDEQQAYVDTARSIDLSPDESAYMERLQPDKLAPLGLELRDLLEQPLGLDAPFRDDPLYRSVLLKVQDAVVLTDEDPATSGHAKRLGPPCLAAGAVIAIAAIVGYVALEWVRVTGETAIEYCDNCYAMALQTCSDDAAPIHKAECHVDDALFTRFAQEWSATGSPVYAAAELEIRKRCKFQCGR